ncbi:uncharacterized protein EV422DRAFT_611920 [Fimicolochytrium jonesii]|uniref:uncharacterized protein n=1 Tax=Fimicolochytrium jonesii TaxID=1396493 RepID=UPI0022FEC8B9|nr:uncharacterized protein EV422DRAFT_611920 [Fimicolochytrium jonesii]KAI8823616.1 hypothetical protein EV422DRAFT_611920 [Fimicolochytrium jonesii]
MSHQSGITCKYTLDCGDELLSAFGKALQSADQRALKVIIDRENATVAEELPTQGSWEDDLSKVNAWFEPAEPAFVLFRLDSKTPAGSYEWILLQYVPDHAKVRDKMLYASTKATLLKELGDANFVDSLYGTLPAELSLEGYRKHVLHKDAEAPLTEREIEMQAVKAAEYSAEIGTTTRRSHAQGVSFAFADEARKSLSDLASGSVNIVVLAVNVAEERVDLSNASTGSFGDLTRLVEANTPRFLFYKPDAGNSAFIYICPPSSKVKERMLYSSSRASVLLAAEEQGFTVSKKFEVSSIDEVTEAELKDEQETAASTPDSVRKTFARPLRPGRGPARVSRPGTPSSINSLEQQ